MSCFSPEAFLLDTVLRSNLLGKKMGTDFRDPDSALSRLLEGNSRFRSGQSTNHRYSSGELKRLSETQTPLAAVIACSDSRVAPEVVFDQPLGSLFACRVPGNVASESARWVVDMAVGEFDVPLVLVAGHSGCLAIDRVLKGNAGAMSGMLKLEILSAIHRARELGLADLAENCVRQNALHAAQSLVGASTVLRNAIRRGRCRCVAGVYWMDSGGFDVLGDAEAR